MATLETRTAAPPVWHFVITTRAAGRVVGHAVVSPDSRYASVRWLAAARIDRCDGQRDWPVVREELTHGWTSRLLPDDSATTALVIPRSLAHVCVLHLLVQPTIEVPEPSQITHALDEYLWAQVGDPRPAA